MSCKKVFATLSTGLNYRVNDVFHLHRKYSESDALMQDLMNF